MKRWFNSGVQNSKFKLLFLSALSGILAGLGATVFLYALEWATRFRQDSPWIIWGLPVAGFFIGWSYYRVGQDISKGHNLIIDQIHQPTKTISPYMAPFIFVSTVLTHLFGGSAGREGTAVQLGASLSDQLASLFHLNSADRRVLLMCGAGAGFGAAIGAPLAGAIFGIEMLKRRGLDFSPWLECLVASYVGFALSLLLAAPHSVFTPVEVPSFSVATYLWLIPTALAFGAAAFVFVSVTHGIENFLNRKIHYAPYRPLIGGLILVAIYQATGDYRFAGLGIEVIQAAFQDSARVIDPFLKLVATAVTVGSGFKGGEFIPLVFIGTTLGSAISAFIPVSVSFLSALGFAAVFGAASNTPIACAIMCAEIFGFSILPAAALVCGVAQFSSGKKSIYKAQR